MPYLEQAAASAAKVDSVFVLILVLSAAFLLFITFLMVFFVIKYSRKRHPKAKDIEGHRGLETAWTVIPLVIFLVMFYFGWTNFEYLRNAPRDAMVVKVTGRQWDWDFEYPNGKKTVKELYLAVDRPVRLEIRSADVIHGFYVPAFRIKMDAVPGKENYTWFTPTQLGTFDIECSVICGTNHSYMLGKAVVVPEDDFKEWYFGGEDAAPPGTLKTAAAVGPAVPDHPAFAILKDNQCLTCHSTDGSVMVGPTFRGVFGAKQTVNSQGEEREVVVDEAYLVKAIQDPMSEIVKGYPETMPLNSLSGDELDQVVDFIRELAPE